MRRLPVLNKFNVLDYTTVCFDQCHVFPSMVRVIEGKIIIENDLKGKKNWFELAGGSNYRGFELPRIKL